MADAAELPDGTGQGPDSPGLFDDPVWDDWDSPPRIPSMPVLHLEGFDGPMDLLLDLAERQRIDLGRISILSLATQFTNVLDRLGVQISIERRADWVVLAARLLLLRARLLFRTLPKAEDASTIDADVELDRLCELAAMRTAAAWLDKRVQLGRDVFARAPPSDQGAAIQRAGGYVALMEACLAVLRSRTDQPNPDPEYQVVVQPLWRVPDAMAWITTSLMTQPAGGVLLGFVPSFTGELANRPGLIRSATASTFVAVLELARDGQVDLHQSTAEDDVWVQAVL